MWILSKTLLRHPPLPPFCDNGSNKSKNLAELEGRFSHKGTEARRAEVSDQHKCPKRLFRELFLLGRIPSLYSLFFLVTFVNFVRGSSLAAVLARLARRDYLSFKSDVKEQFNVDRNCDMYFFR